MLPTPGLFVFIFAVVRKFVIEQTLKGQRHSSMYLAIVPHDFPAALPDKTFS